MTQIKFFVAGSTHLKEERSALKEMVSDMNSQRESLDTSFTLYSFEHFNDDQTHYNRFIEEEADVVVFVLDGCIGTKTRDEFIRATDSLKLNHHPEIMVFLRGANEKTEAIGEIKGLLEGRLGSSRYYVEFADTKDLISKVKVRLQRFARDEKKRRELDARAKEKESGRLKALITDFFKGRFRYKHIIALLTGIILVMAGFMIYDSLRKERIIIFAGGGSVKNFIENTCGVDIFKYPNSVYCHLASGTAWALLIEEANRTQENKGQLERFTSVCLSADNIDSTSFMNEKTKGIFNKSRIVRYNIGNDTLMVYVHNSIVKKMNLDPKAGVIPVEDMRTVVKRALREPENCRIFTTSKTSGTLRIFQKCFEPSDSVNLETMLDKEQSFLFYKDSEADYINTLGIPNYSKPYIILASRHYFPETLESANTKHFTKFCVMREAHPVIKPMNLYFLASIDYKERDCFRIRPQVLGFLKAIKADRNITPEIWNNLNKCKVIAEDGNLILNLN